MNERFVKKIQACLSCPMRSLKLRLQLLGDLAAKAGKRESLLNLERDRSLTLKELLLNLPNLLGIEEAQNIESSYMVMVNGVSIPSEKWESSKLKDNDLIVIAPLYIGGG